MPGWEVGDPHRSGRTKPDQASQELAPGRSRRRLLQHRTDSVGVRLLGLLDLLSRAMGQRRRSGQQPRGPERVDPRGAAPRGRRRSQPWPGLAVLALALATVSILVLNQQHSGDPLKVRRELRKF